MPAASHGMQQRQIVQTASGQFSGIWKRVRNPAFIYGEFATIASQAGLNSYKVSVKVGGDG
jgi:hypothetical protein